MKVRERLSTHGLLAPDRLVLLEEDPEMEAEGVRISPEVAHIHFAFTDPKDSVQEVMSLTVYSDGAFSVGLLGTVSTNNFHGASDAIARAKAMVEALGLRPKVWRPRP